MPWAVKTRSGSTCHRKKSSAKRRAKALRAAGRKARIVKRKSCG